MDIASGLCKRPLSMLVGFVTLVLLSGMDLDKVNINRGADNKRLLVATLEKVTATP